MILVNNWGAVSCHTAPFLQIMIMKKLFLFFCFLSLCVALQAAEHRFYANEGQGDCYSPEGIECVLSSETTGKIETITISLKNLRHTPFQPVRAGLQQGIDTYMDSYPEWNEKFFPTMMMCEPHHFYGYLQSPSGKMKAVASADAIASWSLDYNLGYQDPAPHWFMGHRIKSLRLDLLAALPLPAHHPQHLYQLQPGEQRSWTIQLIDVADASDFEQMVHNVCNVPMLRLEKTSAACGQKTTIEVFGQKPRLSIEGKTLSLERKNGDLWQAEFAAAKPGIYNIEVEDGDRSAHGTINVREPWRKTIELAREGALHYKQKATSHVESWYGFHTAFLAARYFPCEEIDRQLNERFDMIMQNLYDETGRPRKYEWRIQNTSSTIGMLVDRYEAYGNKADLDRACQLADWMIAFSQKENGAYMSGKTVYSSVIYPAKSILELADAELKAGRKKDARRHELSAKRAIDQLVASQGDFNTEGQITYEDGMVSCSALQIGLFALRQKDQKLRKHYADAMMDILRGHDCLTQLRVADGRRRGGTMRYWEAQYDVLMLPNMISSPHGWSAWRAYATYYAYLLTGEERWLRETFDAAASFASLIDYETGKLRWAFVVDPQLQVRQIAKPDTTFTADMPSYGNPHPDMYSNCSFTIGEQYVDMISDWQTIVSCDNDVHEVFKFIVEAVLDKAYIVEREDGTFSCYNCRVVYDGDELKVVADEAQMKTLYASLKTKRKVQFDGEVITNTIK